MFNLHLDLSVSLVLGQDLFNWNKWWEKTSNNWRASFSKKCVTFSHQIINILTRISSLITTNRYKSLTHFNTMLTYRKWNIPVLSRFCVICGTLVKRFTAQTQIQIWPFIISSKGRQSRLIIKIEHKGFQTLVQKLNQL